jgi:hypothetical protein
MQRTILSIIAVCLFSIPAQAQPDGAVDPGLPARTSRYIFLSDQSTLVQTGGIAGVNWTYTVEGQFLLTVDSEACTASFAMVDANATDDSDDRRTLDPNEVFAMSMLVGTVLSDTTLDFTGQAADGSNVHITATLQEDLVHLVAETVPPPGSADFFVFTMDAVAQRKYAGGTGDPNDPYQIVTAADLIALGEDPNDYDKHFILTGDIDLDPNLPGRKVFDKAIIAPDTDVFKPGFQGTPFTGFLDGNGHTISHLTITGGDRVGLFGYLESGAQIRGLGVVDININGDDAVGGLAGYSEGDLTACNSIGTVSGRTRVGGLVGNIRDGAIAHCCSAGSVSSGGGYCIGGLVGYVLNGSVTHCRSTSTVKGGRYSVAGLVEKTLAVLWLSATAAVRSSPAATSAGSSG